MLKDFEGKIPEGEKSKLISQKEELSKALKENAPIDQIKRLSEDLQQTIYSVSSAAYQEASKTSDQPGGQGGDPNPSKSSSDEDVIDAEYSKS